MKMPAGRKRKTEFLSFLSPPLSITTQSFSFLFSLRQSRNNYSNFIEYLIHARRLTALDCVLHGLIPNEGKFRPAVSKILKRDHVVRAVYGLMLYSNLRRINLVSLR